MKTEYFVYSIVDTGAMRTCYNAAHIDLDLKEEDFKQAKTIEITGYIKGGNTKTNSVKFYQYNVRQFTIGTVDIKAQTIWITFDE